ncbi:MAG: tRNA-uridine aminocarboxypropyltransferase [Fuerstiella sp.]
MLSDERAASFRARCYECYRPTELCFCDQIPSIANRTQILILQHVKERFHAFNTARIVRKALQNCELIVDQTARLTNRSFPFLPSTGILYPGDESILLSDLPEHQRPDQLVVLDGTWHHSKTFMKQIPVLQKLPRFRLEPAAPSNYRIRKEPTESALSTLEATVAALKELEPQTQDLDLLLKAFDYMIDSQVQHPMQAGRLRRRPADRPWNPKANIPTALMSNPGKIVVAYGEAAHGIDGVRSKHRDPIYWVAQRLVTEEKFECAIKSDSVLSSEFMQHLKLQPSSFEDALTTEQFAQQWSRFLKPDDTVVVFNSSTLKLLDAVTINRNPSFVMKSVNVQSDVSTLSERMKLLDISPAKVSHHGRAGERLGNAIAFAQYLHRLGTGDGS